MNRRQRRAERAQARHESTGPITAMERAKSIIQATLKHYAEARLLRCFLLCDVRGPLPIIHLFNRDDNSVSLPGDVRESVKNTPAYAVPFVILTAERITAGYGLPIKGDA